MLPEAKSEDLLYISTFDGVIVYSYPSDKQVGLLSGSGSEAYGLCSDEAGNLFVTDLEAQAVYEYAHGGTQPIATFTQYPSQDFSPIDCSVDPVTDNLAVESADSYSVYIFKHEGQTATIYENPYAYGYFCTYDGSGNFFARGTQYHIAELPKGSSTFTNIKLSRPIEDLEGFAWDGKYLSITNYTTTNTDYRIHVHGSRATIVSSSILTNAKFVRQFTIYNHRFIAPDEDASQVTFWKYPGFGNSTGAIQGLTDPEGSAISVAR
jgi:hypothetical protein